MFTQPNLRTLTLSLAVASFGQRIPFSLRHHAKPLGVSGGRFMRQNKTVVLLVAAAALLLIVTPANAQNCETSNCARGAAIPAECQNRATPRLETVLMTGAFVFSPDQPRIEGGNSAYQCIEWQSTALTHSSTENVGCDSTGTACAAINPVACDWETGNVAATGTCHYGSVTPASYGFHCRFHEPPLFNMVGTLTVVSQIELLVNKSGADVQLDWAIGGVGPWNVFSDGSAPMPAPTTLLGATVLRSHTDVAPVGDRYYLVMEDN